MDWGSAKCTAPFSWLTCCFTRPFILPVHVDDPQVYLFHSVHMQALVSHLLVQSLHLLLTWRILHARAWIRILSLSVNYCLLHKHTNDDVFDHFPKISDHFPKISEDFQKLFRRPDERFGTFSKHFPKITEDCRGRPKIRRCFDHTSTNLSEGTK